MSFFVSNGNPTAIANGMAFVIQRDPRGPTATGATGAALGFSNGTNALGQFMPGIANGFALRFVSYAAGAQSASLGVCLNNSVFYTNNPAGSIATQSNFKWYTGAIYTATITYSQYTGTMAVAVSGGGNVPTTFSFSGINLAASLGCTTPGCLAYFGVTASTGAYYGTFVLESFQYLDTTPTPSATLSTGVTPSTTPSVPPTSTPTSTPTSSATNTWTIAGNALWAGPTGSLPVSVTNGNTGQTGALWWPQKVAIDAFTWTIQFQIIAGSACCADGLVIALQTQGITALGGGGGNLGYSGISPSAGIRCVGS